MSKQQYAERAGEYLMNKEKMVSRLYSLFVNRSDVFARQFLQGNKKGFKKIDRKITNQDFQNHLENKDFLGVYQLNQNNNVKWGCLDFDKNTKEDYEKAKELYNKLNEKLNPVFEKSGGGEYKAHIWIFSHKPIPAKQMKDFLEWICKKTKLKPHEIFPKQTQIKKDEYGNLVKVPLGKHLVTKKQSVFLDNDFNEVKEKDLEGFVEEIYDNRDVIPIIQKEVKETPKTTFNSNGAYDNFFEYVLNNELPKGSTKDVKIGEKEAGVNNNILKNLAIWLKQKGYNLDKLRNEIKPLMLEKGRSKASYKNLEGWFKKTLKGDLNEISKGELIVWAKKYSPSLIDFLREKKDKPKTEKARIIDEELEEVAKKLKDPVDIEIRLKEIKEKYDISLKILREKLKNKKIEYIKKNKGKTENLSKSIDKRFNQEDLLIHINKEITKDHIEDDREKLGMFIAELSSQLPNPKDHISVAVKGNASTGKTNAIFSTLKHIPNEKYAIATRITQSEIEDRLDQWDILIVSEMNINREFGANKTISETFKQVMEDGINIFKKDNVTGESKEINVEQKSGIYSTTETETDEELETRYILIPIKSDLERNRKIVYNVFDNVSDIDFIINKLKEKESWIATSLRGLNKNLEVVIPFAKELKKKIKIENKEVDLLDFSKERVVRDVKRLISLTKAIAWIFQKRRIIKETKGDKIIIAEPTDFLTALKIFTPFFNISYSGLDPRIEKTLEKIKELQGKYNEEISRIFGSSDRANWVIRSELQKELGILSVNTIKDHIEILKDRMLINTHWDENHRKCYLIRPINSPISHLLDPVTLIGIDRSLTGAKMTDFYKKYGKKHLDSIKLPKSIQNLGFSDKLIGDKLIGVNPESVSLSMPSKKCFACGKQLYDDEKSKFKINENYYCEIHYNQVKGAFVEK